MSMLGKAFQTFRISNSLSTRVPSRRLSSIRGLTSHLPRVCARIFRRCNSSSGEHHKGDDSLQRTLATLSILRDHARQIDVVKENLLEPVPGIFNNELTAFQNGNGFENSAELAAKEVETWKGPLKQLFANVPESLENKMNDFAVTSIQFSFDVDKSDIANHMLLNSNKELTTYDLLYQPKNLLNFKTLIQGTIELNSPNNVNNFLSGVKMSEFSEKVNDIATNICTNSLQRAFMDNGTRMTFSTNSISISSNVGEVPPPTLYRDVPDNVDTTFQCVKQASSEASGESKLPKAHKKSEYIVCVGTKEKGCVSPGNAGLPTYPPSNQTDTAQEKECQTVTIKFQSMNEIIGELGCWDLMSSGVYDRALEEAAKRREYMLMITKKALNNSLQSKREDTPRKIPSPCKIDPCENPCIRKQKPKPCPKKPTCPKVPSPPPPCRAEQEKVEIHASCKKDPCKKKEDPCKKKDPCKKEDPCKKKEDPCKKKKDPCKKEDPCKKKEDPCKKKEDPCKKKEDPCKKKKDPCKKEDPCKKKEDPCKKKEDPCKKKKDPCKKEDPCKKKDPCKKADASNNAAVCEEAQAPSKKSKKSKAKARAKARMAKCCLKPSEKKEPMSMADFIEEACCRRALAEKAKQENKNCPSSKPETKKVEAKSQPPSSVPPKSSKSGCQKVCESKDKSSNIKATPTNAKGTPKQAKTKANKKVVICGKRSGNTKPNCKNSAVFGKKKSDSTKRSYSTRTLVWNFVNSILNKHEGVPSTKSFSSSNDKKHDSGCVRNQKADKSVPKNRIDKVYPKSKNCFNEPDGTCPRINCKDDCLTGCQYKNKCAPPCRGRNLKKSGCVHGNPEEPGCRGSAGKKNKGENIEKEYSKYIKNNNRTFLNTLFSNNSNIIREFKRNMSTESKNTMYQYKEDQECDEDRECKNEIICITDTCKISTERIPLPFMTNYDALIRVEAVALTGSDIHQYETGGKTTPGISLGHDATGVVEKVGLCVQNLKPGDRVALESGLSCGICEYCKSGTYNMCAHMMYNGFLIKYQVHPADLCYKLPEGVTFIEASLTNTLAVGCAACFKANISPLTNLLIIGSGATALSAAFCARALGANNICLTCSIKESLTMMKRNFGFDYVYYDLHMGLNEILEGIHNKLQNWPNVVINCSISEWTMNLSVMALQPCGTCILAECEHECASFNAMDVLMKNLKLIPSFRFANMFPTALYLIDRGYAPMCHLISECFPWKEADSAFRAALHEANIGNKKIIVKCSEKSNSYDDKT